MLMNGSNKTNNNNNLYVLTFEDSFSYTIIPTTVRKQKIKIFTSFMELIIYERKKETQNVHSF